MALAGLGTTPTVVLSGDSPVTLNALAALMRDEHDILYLVCHGMLKDDEPYLYLEDEQGRTAVVAGAELVARIAELSVRPRLVMLVSCESAAPGRADPLTALGPQLAEAGVAAVLAMQGRVSVETTRQMMPVFFRELQRDGQIDRALSVARGQVRDQSDFWMPTLFMRLKSGRIWYTPGFTGQSHGRADEKWEPLISSIRDEECTPIIGPDLIESLIGSRRDLARRLAEDFHFPLAPHDREGLPQVAQYLSYQEPESYRLDLLDEAPVVGVGDRLLRHGSNQPDRLPVMRDP